MDESDYLRNALNLTVFGINFGLRKLREPVNKTDWITHGRPAVVNAYYSPLENSIRNIDWLKFEHHYYFIFLSFQKNSRLEFYKALSSAKTGRCTSTTPPSVGSSAMKLRTALTIRFRERDRNGPSSSSHDLMIIPEKKKKQGRQFDPEGNLAEWWAPETKKKYLERAQCIINQYANFSLPELGLDVWLR